MQRDPNIHRTLHNLLPGTPEWHAFRAEHYGASEAPAMLGCSPYKNRSDLIRERTTGIKPEIDAFTQKRFDDGHKFEGWARPLAEAIIGDALYPNTASLGKMSASFDGLTMCETVAWEHKTMNDQIRACETAAELPLVYRAQMEQQLHIVGAERALFSATRWGDSSTVPLEEKHLWYLPDLVLRQQIIAGWEQFDADVKGYVHRDILEPAKAAALADLPVVTVQARGELAMCNLNDVTPAFDKFLAEAKVDLVTDEDFALAEAQAKKGRAAAQQCKLTAKAVVDQMQSVAEVTRALESYAAKFDAMALRQEKAVKDQKDARRGAAKLERDRAYADHIASLEVELVPLRLQVGDADKPQFSEVMKNQRTLSSLYNKLDTELARAKIAASECAKGLRAKLTWYNANVGDHAVLFRDLQQIIGKAMDDFQLLVRTRIADHERAEQAKQDALRAQIEKQERAKAEAAAAEKLEAARQADADRAAAEQARIAAEAQAAADRQAAAEQAERDRVAAEQQAAAVAEQGRLADLADLAAVETPAASQSVRLEVRETAPASAPTLRLGQIVDRLGIGLTREFIESALKIAPSGRERAAVLYFESDFLPICTALIAHISKVRAEIMGAPE